MSKARVLIVGSGALGLVAAYTLEKYQRAEVTIIVRSNYEKASAQGYDFDSVQFGTFSNWKPTKVVASVHQAIEYSSFDYILVSLKNLPDSPKTVEDIIHDVVKANPQSTIVLLQNGIDIEKPIIERFPGHAIISGVSLIGCTNVDCKVKQMTKDTVQFGLFENPTVTNTKKAEESLREWLRIYTLDDKSNNITLDSNVRFTRWKKLVYNSAINTTTALVNLDCSRAAMGGYKESVCRPIIKEIYKIAKADGYVIPPELEQTMLDISDGLFYTPSMLVDVRLGRMIELETIVGNPLKIAKTYGIDAPHLEMIYGLLQLVQFRMKEKLGYIKVEENAGLKKNEDYGKGF